VDGGYGVCIDASVVIHVDNTGGPSCVSGDGTPVSSLTSMGGSGRILRGGQVVEQDAA
jgi:hypothetical protein